MPILLPQRLFLKIRRHIGSRAARFPWYIIWPMLNGLIWPPYSMNWPESFSSVEAINSLPEIGIIRLLKMTPFCLHPHYVLTIFPGIFHHKKYSQVFSRKKRWLSIDCWRASRRWILRVFHLSQSAWNVSSIDGWVVSIRENLPNRIVQSNDRISWLDGSWFGFLERVICRANLHELWPLIICKSDRPWSSWEDSQLPTKLRANPGSIRPDLNLYRSPDFATNNTNCPHSSRPFTDAQELHLRHKVESVKLCVQAFLNPHLNPE